MKQGEREASGRLYQVFPFLDWLKRYQLPTFRDGSIAEVTVAVVTIPRYQSFYPSKSS
jgi:hypothetical protein